MNVVILSPHFPPNYHHFCVAWTAGGRDRPRHRRRAATTSCDPSCNCLDGVLPRRRRARLRPIAAGVAYLTFRHGKMDRLESHNEFWLETDARLRTDFNIPGIKNDRLTDIKAKSRMKARYIAAGVPVARGAVARSWSRRALFIAEIGYPVVRLNRISAWARPTPTASMTTSSLSASSTSSPRSTTSGGVHQWRHLSFDGLADR